MPLNKLIECDWKRKTNCYLILNNWFIFFYELSVAILLKWVRKRLGWSWSGYLQYCCNFLHIFKYILFLKFFYYVPCSFLFFIFNWNYSYSRWIYITFPFFWMPDVVSFFLGSISNWAYWWSCHPEPADLQRKEICWH